eukprot:COSAG01_NODE_2540_length_7478_cov_13.257759_2_plen_160_part_00
MQPLPWAGDKGGLHDLEMSDAFRSLCETFDYEDNRRDIAMKITDGSNTIIVWYADGTLLATAIVYPGTPNRIHFIDASGMPGRSCLEWLVENVLTGPNIVLEDATTADHKKFYPSCGFVYKTGMNPNNLMLGKRGAVLDALERAWSESNLTPDRPIAAI